MTKKTLFTLLLVLLSFESVALGLRGITVSSHLNQPLNAEIELISSNIADVQDIKAKLASPKAYDKAGVDRVFILTKLRFQTKALPSGKRVLVVTSDGLIREPFLNFLIEVSWPDGSLVREYTILLDPPTYKPRLPVAVQAVKQAGTAVGAETSLVDRYGPVKGNETLWVIAEKVRPDNRLTIPQVMMGLLQQNPTAFQDENVNLLRKGVMLDIPAAENIVQLDASTALNRFQRQTRQWREKRGSVSADAPITDGFLNHPAVAERFLSPTLDPISESEKQPTQATGSDSMGGTRLRVVETGRQWLLSDTSHIVYPVADSAKLKEAIADSKQDLAAVKEINQDIEGLRIALETKVDALTLALEEKELAIEQLRQQLDQAAVVSDTESAEQTDTNEQAVSSNINPVEVNPPAALNSDPPTSREANKRADYWMTVGIVGSLLLVAGIILLYRFKKSPETTEETALYDPFAEQPEAAPSVEVVTASTMEFSHQESAEKSFTVDEDTFSGSHTDTASILTEADIYLAYRRYTQAESLIIEALEHNPRHPELEAKLLEIYAFKKDKNAFVGYLEQVGGLIRLNNPDIWLKIVDMGQDIGVEHRLFEGSVKVSEEKPDDNDVEPPPEDIDFAADQMLDLEFSPDEFKENMSDVDKIANGLSDSDDLTSIAVDDEDEDRFLPDIDPPADTIPPLKLDLNDEDEGEDKIPMIDIDLDDFEDTDNQGKS